MSLSRVPGPDELYVGGIFTLRRPSGLEAAKITHIVSVLRYDFKEMQGWEKYQHCNVDVDDDDGENLLGELPRTTRFIIDAFKSGGAVLVHCAMGKSRSVAVTIAYLLATRGLSLPTPVAALEVIRQSRPIAEPNPGFMEQLEIYQSMRCPLEDIDNHPVYQRWLYRREVELSVATGRAPDVIRFEDEIALGESAAGKEGGEDRDRPGVGKNELRCRKCRRTLATEQYMIPHTPKSTSSPSASTYEPISSFSPSSQTTHHSCTHHFIHPLSWMRPTLSTGDLDGRLECPNPRCRANVGRYAWQGLRCSCGLWIVPAFSLQGGKVDLVSLGGAKNSGGLRRPPGGALGAGIRMPPGQARPAPAEETKSAVRPGSSSQGRSAGSTGVADTSGTDSGSIPHSNHTSVSISQPPKNERGNL